VAACVPRSFGQLVCAGDGDCTARGQTCSELDTIGGALTPVCGHPPGGVGALNDACIGSALENPNQCESGFCDDAQDGRCVDTCVSDADCGGTMICTDSHLGNVVGRWCAEPCTTMVGCGFDAVDPDSRICKRRCDTVDQKFELACTPPVGTKNLNEALSAAESATNCKSGFSLTSGGATYCSQPCVVDGDCTIGMSCAAGNQTCSGGASEPFKRCRRL
jgi:hypothetical protein